MVIAGILVVYVLPTALSNSGSCPLDRDDRASSGVEMEGVLLGGRAALRPLRGIYVAHGGVRVHDCIDCLSLVGTEWAWASSQPWNTRARPVKRTDGYWRANRSSVT